MQREIKFRAWDEESEEMFYSDGQTDRNYFEFLNGKLRAWRVIEKPGTIHEPPYPASEILDNIMEYTGLKAKNGEIYENDIVRVRSLLGTDHIGQVKFADGCFNIYFPQGMMRRCGFMRMRNYLKCYTVNHAVEIIGNIYENDVLSK